jgi:putative ABC transport system ATP-binding protein
VSAGQSLRLEQVTHVYPTPEGADQPLLSIDAWCFEPGQQVLLRGVSGSGKTTLLNIIAGLLQPTTGIISLGAQSIYALPEADRDRFRATFIGYAFQNHLLLPAWTALENVMLPLRFAGRFPQREWKPRATVLLERVGMHRHLNHRPRQLSTGQRLRVAIARALVNEPGLLLADEPTAALDSGAGETVISLMQEICAATQAILLVASHDPALSSHFSITLDLHQAHFPVMGTL